MTEQFKTEFTYEFKIPFKYAYKGELIEAKKITIKSPNNIVKNFVTKIDEQRLIASKNWQDKMNIIVEDKKEDTKTELQESDIVEFIGSGGGNFNICFEALRDILKSGNENSPVALLDDETKVTSPLFDNFSYIDTKNILGGYIKNFLLSSRQA